MFSYTVVLGLLGASAASPLPGKHTADGVQLRLKLADGAKDFSPPVAGTYVGGHHVGAANSWLVAVSAPDRAPVFYRNGTQQDDVTGGTKLVAMTGEWAPFHLDFAPSQKKHFDAIKMGATDGDTAIGQTGSPKPSYPHLGPTGDLYAVCPTILEGETQKTPMLYHIDHNEKSAPSSGELGEDCVEVMIELICSSLRHDIPDGLTWSPYDNLLKSHCTPAN